MTDGRNLREGQNLRVGFWLGEASLRYGGIGPYALRVLDSLLVNAEPGWQFVLLCDEESSNNDARRIIEDSQSRIAHVQLIPSPPTNESLWRQFRRARSRINFNRRALAAHYPQDYLETWINGLNLDLIHFPAQTPPFPGEEHIPYVVPPLLNVRTPYVVTAHDVQELRFPEYFSPAQRAIRAMHKWETLDHAGKIIVSFDHVKADLIKFFNLPESKIHVCPIPFNSISLAEPSPAAAQNYCERYASWTPYLLYPAQTWRHKNHALLFRSLQRLHRQGHTNLRLICTGAKNDYYPTLEAQIEQMQLRDFILFTGLVPEDELTWLYEHAAVVTIPTEYEAGSFPLFEAILQGAPVVCSDVTSLPETIGDPRFVFDPHDAQALSELILRLISDAGFREANVANSVKQAKKLRRVNAATHFYATYRSLLGIDNASR